MADLSPDAAVEAPGRLRLAYVAPDALLRAPYNPRTMTDEARSALKRGIEAFGLVDPLVARGEDGLLLGGHQRLQAAEELGLAEVPVVYMDGVSDQQAAALNVLLNNPSAQGSWDMARLSSLLSELDAGGFDATLTGFSEKDLEEMLTWTGDGIGAVAFPDLPSGAKGDFEQMTFTLHRDQADMVREALEVAKQAGEFVDTGNENSNGNALARVAEMALGALR